MQASMTTSKKRIKHDPAVEGSKKIKFYPLSKGDIEAREEKRILGQRHKNNTKKIERMMTLLDGNRKKSNREG